MPVSLYVYLWVDMLKTARNLALDHVKRAGFRLVDSLDAGGDKEGESDTPRVRDTLEQVCSDEEFALFCAAVRDLPLQCRRAFVLSSLQKAAFPLCVKRCVLRVS